MGAYRDEQLFAEMEARDSGVQSGDRSRLFRTASSLGVALEVIDNLDVEQNLVARAARLETIADSVGSLLADAREKLAVLETGSPEEVAGSLIADQLLEDSSHSKYTYFGSTDVFRFDTVDDGQVMVLTEVHGGPMVGPFTFGFTMPLTAEWVDARMQSRGVQREPDFCAQVADSVMARLINAGEATNG